MLPEACPADTEGKALLVLLPQDRAVSTSWRQHLNSTPGMSGMLEETQQR